MKSANLIALSDNELIEEFRHAARELGEVVVNWMPGVRETQRLFAIRNLLRQRGQQSRLKLMPLLDDKDPYVRYYAAHELLALAPQRSRSIIEESARGHDAIAGDAKGLIRDLDNSQYKPH